jgi:hypothetical protein
VAEVLISFHRPASMSKSEMRAWVSERARVGQPAVALGAASGAESDPLVLRVEVREDRMEAAEEQLADLMMDMRLLGLRPAIVSPRG